MDKIEEVLKRLDEGKVNEEEAIMLLEAGFNNYINNEDQINRNVANKISEMSRLESQTPEQILVEEERIREIVIAFELFLAELTPRYQELLYLYIVEGHSQAKCADLMGIGRPRINGYFQKINAKLRKIGEQNPNLDNLICRGLYDNLKYKSIASYHSQSSKSQGLPFENAMRVESGSWYEHNKSQKYKKTYATKSKCMLPQYLSDSFPNETVYCPNLCGGTKNCTNNSKTS